MAKYFSATHQFLTLECDGTFKLEYGDDGYGMDDAERQEYWIAKGKWIQLSVTNGKTYKFEGIKNGNVSGSHTDRVNCCIVPYSNKIENEVYQQEIDLSTWKIEKKARGDDIPRFI